MTLNVVYIKKSFRIYTFILRSKRRNIRNENKENGTFNRTFYISSYAHGMLHESSDHFGIRAVRL